MENNQDFNFKLILEDKTQIEAIGGMGIIVLKELEKEDSIHFEAAGVDRCTVSKLLYVQKI